MEEKRGLVEGCFARTTRFWLKTSGPERPGLPTDMTPGADRRKMMGSRPVHKRRRNSCVWLSSEIKKTTDLGKVLEEQILDSRVELSLREVLGITKKEFHNSIINLIKRKRLSTELG